MSHEHRATLPMIRKRIDYLNRMFGFYPEPYSQDKDGKLLPNLGTYHLTAAYGGFALHQMLESGGERDVFRVGYVPKALIYDLINAFIDGIETQERYELGSSSVKI